jgi:endonuclease/exonuclease/phosphatase family metal-dependent hydrolase
MHERNAGLTANTNPRRPSGNPTPASTVPLRCHSGTRNPLLGRLVFIGLLVLGGTAAPAAVIVTNLVIASWNVENLFDAVNDPDNPGDDDFTPRGKMYWSAARYAQKLTNLAEVVAAMKPDILCLVEVENRRVLEDLSRVTATAFDWNMPVIIHREGGDKRGIDVAILSRHAPSNIAWTTPVTGMRDQLAATFDFGGRELTVFCNHWKSWSGNPETNASVRIREASHLSRQVRTILTRQTNAAVIATGDFNDLVTSDILIHSAGFVPWPPALGHPTNALLNNLSGLLPPASRGTYYFSRNRVWNSFDSISVSPGMLPGSDTPAAWQAATNTYAIFISSAQTNSAGRPLSYWRARSEHTSGRRRIGYSDHFPVRVELRSLPAEKNTSPR